MSLEKHSLPRLSDLEKIQNVFARLRRACYKADLFADQDTIHAQQLARRRLEADSAGHIYGTRDQQSCFDQQGNLVKALTLYWAGYGPGLVQLFQETGMCALYRGDGTSTLLLIPGPEIVTLCGSTRFSEDFYWENRRLTRDGVAIYSIGCDFKSDEVLGLTQENKQSADRLHWWKVAECRVVYVLNRGDYIGESTGAEIRLARALNKDIWWLEPHHCAVDCRCHTGPAPNLSGEKPLAIYLTAPFDLLAHLRDFNLRETLRGCMVLTCGEDQLEEMPPSSRDRLVKLRRWKIAHAQRIIALSGDQGYDWPTQQDVIYAKQLQIPLVEVRL